MKIFGLELAPLRIPFERRLQTISVYQYTLMFLFMGFSCVGLSIYLLFTRFYFISLLYGAWYLYDRKISSQGGRSSQWVRSWKVWKHFANYFPLTLVKSVELNPDKNYIFACHPHGVMCYSHFCNFATEGTNFSDMFPSLRPHLLTLVGQFKFPFFREYFMLSGACEASKKSIRHLLTREGKGNVLALIIGGAMEALNASPGSHKIILKSRKGFIKLALQYGADICPVYAFGENDLYVQVSNPEGSFLRRLQHLSTHVFGFSPPLFHGRGVFNYTFGLMPYRKPVYTIVGKPIEVEKNENPSQEDIDNLHQKYVEALTELFESNKGKYGVKEEDHLEFE